MAPPLPYGGGRPYPPQCFPARPSLACCYSCLSRCRSACRMISAAICTSSASFAAAAVCPSVCRASGPAPRVSRTPRPATPASTRFPRRPRAMCRRRPGLGPRPPWRWDAQRGGPPGPRASAPCRTPAESGLPSASSGGPWLPRPPRRYAPGSSPWLYLRRRRCHPTSFCVKRDGRARLMGRDRPLFVV